MLERLELDESPLADDPSIQSLWADEEFFVSVHTEGDDTYRLVVMRMADCAPYDTSVSVPLSFEDVQHLKREVGFADRCAVEVFPADENVVAGPAVRHVIVLPQGQHVGWIVDGDS